MTKPARSVSRKRGVRDRFVGALKKRLATCERLLSRRAPDSAWEEFDEGTEALIARAFGEASDQLEAYQYAQTGEAAGIVNLPEEAQESGAVNTFRESLQQRKAVLEGCLALLSSRKSRTSSTARKGKAVVLPAGPRVADHMSHDVRSVHQEATLKEAARLLQKWKVGSLLVDDGSRYIGIITDTDLSRKAVARGLDAASTAVRSCMSKPIVSIEDSEPLGEAIGLMKRRAIRHLAVTEDGTIIGVLSVSDLLRAYGSLADPSVQDLTTD